VIAISSGRGGGCGVAVAGWRLRGGGSTARGRDPGAPPRETIAARPHPARRLPTEQPQAPVLAPTYPSAPVGGLPPHGATPAMCFLRRHGPDQVVAVAVGTASQLGASDLSEGRQLPRISRASHLLPCTDGMPGTRAVRPCPARTTSATGRHPGPRRRDGHAGLGTRAITDSTTGSVPACASPSTGTMGSPPGTGHDEVGGTAPSGHAHGAVWAIDRRLGH
jgi:hypothetical protein